MRSLCSLFWKKIHATNLCQSTGSNFVPTRWITQTACISFYQVHNLWEPRSESLYFTEVVSAACIYTCSRVKFMLRPKPHIQVFLCQIIFGQKGLCQQLFTEWERVHLNLFVLLNSNLNHQKTNHAACVKKWLLILVSFVWSSYMYGLLLVVHSGIRKTMLKKKIEEEGIH